MFFSTCKYVWFSTITHDILAHWPLPQVQAKGSKIQSVDIRVRELAKSEGKSYLVKNVSSVEIGSSGSLRYLLLGVIWDHLLFGHEKLYFVAFHSLSAMRHATESLCSRSESTLQFHNIHQSFP